MGLETGTKLAQLNANWPLGSDMRAQGDDHLRLIKSIVKGDVVSKADGGSYTGSVTFNGTLTTTGSVSIAGPGNMILGEDVILYGKDAALTNRPIADTRDGKLVVGSTGFAAQELVGHWLIDSSISGAPAFTEGLSVNPGQNFSIGDGTPINWPISTGGVFAQAIVASNGAFSIGSTAFASQELRGSWKMTSSISGSPTFTEGLLVSAGQNVSFGDGTALTWPASTGGGHIQAMRVFNGALALGSASLASQTLTGPWTTGGRLTLAAGMTVSNGAATGGISFGNSLPASPTDTGKHISLHQNGHGISVTSGRLNILGGTATQIDNYLGASMVFGIKSDGFVTPSLTVTGAAIMNAVNDANMSLKSLGAGRLHFQIDAVNVARVEPGGTAAPSTLSVMTREKGDFRYALKTTLRDALMSFSGTTVAELVETLVAAIDAQEVEP